MLAMTAKAFIISNAQRTASEECEIEGQPRRVGSLLSVVVAVSGPYSSRAEPTPLTHTGVTHVWTE